MTVSKTTTLRSIVVIMVLLMATSAWAQSRRTAEFGNDPWAADVQEPELPDHARAKPFGLALGLEAGYGYAAGDFYERADPGLMYGGTLRVPVSPKHYIKFVYRDQLLLTDDVRIDEYGNMAEAKYRLRQYLAMFGLLQRASDGRRLGAYSELGMGVGDHVASAEHAGATLSSGMSRFLLAADAGAMIRLGDGPMVLDAGISVTAKLFGGNQWEGKGFAVAAHLGLMLPLHI